MMCKGVCKIRNMMVIEDRSWVILECGRIFCLIFMLLFWIVVEFKWIWCLWVLIELIIIKFINMRIVSNGMIRVIIVLMYVIISFVWIKLGFVR